MIVRGRMVCDGLDASVELWCERSPYLRVSYQRRRPDGSTARTEWIGCRVHAPGFLDEVDQIVAAYRWRDPAWPAPVVEGVELHVTGRDKAHGRPGTWRTMGEQDGQLSLM